VRGSYNGLVYIWVFSLLPHSEVVSLDAAMLPVVVSRQHAQDGEYTGALTRADEYGIPLT
jgi:hypothetical protein